MILFEIQDVYLLNLYIDNFCDIHLFLKSNTFLERAFK
jgi:hypothetical protein